MLPYPLTGRRVTGIVLRGIQMLFPTTLVGSYPQPEWLIDRQKLASRFPPRVRVRELQASASADCVVGRLIVSLAVRSSRVPRARAAQEPA